VNKRLSSLENLDIRKLAHESQKAGVEITTRLLAKCEWNLELASNALDLLASLASVFSFSPSK
jgi:hypothetical protein